MGAGGSCGWARRQEKLDAGRIEPLVAALRSFETEDAELAHQLLLEADYFQRNAERMRSTSFDGRLFVGSGVIEAGCRTVIASRLKRSGMFWSVRGANAIVALRCARLTRRRFDVGQSRPGGLSVTNLSHTPLTAIPSDRPAAVQGAKRRSEPLTARTDLESSATRERGFKSEGEGPVEEAPGGACADARVETLC